MGAYLAVFVASAGTVLILTPLVRMLAVRVGAIARPSDRRVHAKPTPTLGGIGILAGILAGLGVAFFLPSFRAVFHESTEVQGAILAGVIITAVGLVDDLKTLSAPAKVAGQILAAGLLILNGVELLFFWFPRQGVISLGSDLAVPLTIAWVLVLVNAINLIDGLDGLAAGIVVIASGAFFVYLNAVPSTFPLSTSAAALVCAVTGGAALGFLPYNFNPARIFMGDSGAMLLGTMLAAATISGVGRTVEPSGGDIAALTIPVLIPVIVLAVPLLDVGMAVARRVRRGRPVFAPDKEHLHHQLQEIGHSHRQTVLIMYLWSIVLAGAALAITFINSRTVVGVVLAAAVVVIAATFVPRRIRRYLRARRARKGPAPAGAEVEVGAKP